MKIRSYVSLKTILCSFLIMFFSSELIFAKEAIINLIAEDYKPLSYLENDSLNGPSADIVSILNRKLNYNQRIKVYPWKRGYFYVLNKKNTALFSTTRTEERESLFKWVGPLAEKRFNMYALKKSNLEIKEIKKAADYTIGVENGTINEQLLLSRGLNNLERVTTPKQNLLKLLYNRIDIWCVSASTFSKTAAELNIDPHEFEQIFTVKKAKLYIAFSIDTPDRVITSWQTLYDELYKKGVIKEIYAKYKLDYLYPED